MLKCLVIIWKQVRINIVEVNETRFDQQSCCSEKPRRNRTVDIQSLIILEFEPQNLGSMGLWK
uniref:Tho2 protein, putative n=1 Tax=Arundo donax TaxID=35708 RepID=A0A0A9HRT6_ARUDO